MTKYLLRLILKTVYHKISLGIDVVVVVSAKYSNIYLQQIGVNTYMHSMLISERASTRASKFMSHIETHIKQLFIIPNPQISFFSRELQSMDNKILLT